RFAWLGAAALNAEKLLESFGPPSSIQVSARSQPKSCSLQHPPAGSQASAQECRSSRFLQGELGACEGPAEAAHQELRGARVAKANRLPSHVRARLQPSEAAQGDQVVWCLGRCHSLQS